MGAIDLHFNDIFSVFFFVLFCILTLSLIMKLNQPGYNTCVGSAMCLAGGICKFYFSLVLVNADDASNIRSLV